MKRERRTNGERGFLLRAEKSRLRQCCCIALTGVMLLTVLGCAGCGIQRDIGAEKYRELQVTEEKMPAANNGSTDTEEESVDDEFYRVVEEFGVRTAVALAEGKQGANLIYSPLSLYLALALTAQGAVGETQEELLSFLGAKELGAARLAEECSALYNELYREGEVDSFRIANSLWLADNWRGDKISFQKPFLDMAGDQFYASLFSADFTDEATGKAQGEWVAKQTGGLLQPEFKTNEDQILSILNTIYLKEGWRNQFSPGAVEEGQFQLANGDGKTVEFMNGSRKCKAAQGEGFMRASLLLSGKGKVVFVLPDEGVSPEELLQTPERLGEVLSGGEEFGADVTWKLPKFSFSMEEELTELVKEMGVKKAFEFADFSNMVKFENPEAFAYISLIRQGAKFSLDENGVEAAAYTEVAISGTSAAVPEELPQIEMILDRPFLYAVYEGEALVFFGVCQEPEN